MVRGGKKPGTNTLEKNEKKLKKQHPEIKKAIQRREGVQTLMKHMPSGYMRDVTNPDFEPATIVQLPEQGPNQEIYFREPGIENNDPNPTFMSQQEVIATDPEINAQQREYNYGIFGNIYNRMTGQTPEALRRRNPYSDPTWDPVRNSNVRFEGSGMKTYQKEATSKIGHNKTTNDDESNKTGKSMLGNRFLGTYLADKVPYPNDSNKNKYAITNITTSKQFDKGDSGEHWMAISYGPPVTVYDSFGPSSDQRKARIEDVLRPKLGYFQFTDPDAEQKNSETNCLQRSLAWCKLHAIQGQNKAMQI